MLIDLKDWKNSWKPLEDLKGGGQGSAKKVQHKDSGKIGFLKILNKQNDIERRARFYREATAYDSSSHPNIPTLIESNAHNYQNLDYKVYIVTEFISGATLTKLLNKEGSLPFEKAASIVTSLIEIIQYCHDNGWVHRDIKPDNIILNNANEPFLLDFGMAFKEGVTTDFSTEAGQEVGNRFLRLPELRIDSPVKQDIRSDLSLIGGIYFFLLTGIAPTSLKDENGRMPHQRVDALRSLKDKCPNSLIHLLNFFDKAFSEKISDRFLSAESMKRDLVSQIENENKIKTNDIEEDLEIVLSAINTESNRQFARNKKVYDEAMKNIQAVHSDLAKLFSPVYTHFQTGYVNFSEGLRNTLGFCHFANQNIRFAPQFLIKIIGDELVIYADDIAIYRTALESPIFSAELNKTVKEIYIKGMRNLVEDPEL